ncbi:MAG: SRPBCC family protein [Agarilytica sp.]
MTEIIEPINASINVNVAPGDAFIAFTEHFQSWWPMAYTLSKEVLSEIGIEPSEGGFCFEKGPHGFRCDWGRVLQWSPAEALRFTWQLDANSAPQPNPDMASEVSVHFNKNEDGTTRVALDHENLERHGACAAQYRDELASEYGWPYLLQQYQNFVNNQ